VFWKCRSWSSGVSVYRSAFCVALRMQWCCSLFWSLEISAQGSRLAQWQAEANVQDSLSPFIQSASLLHYGPITHCWAGLGLLRKYSYNIKTPLLVYLTSCKLTKALVLLDLLVKLLTCVAPLWTLSRKLKTKPKSSRLVLHKSPPGILPTANMSLGIKTQTSALYLKY